MGQGGYDAKTGNCVLCFQSYVVKTPHHNILVDACIGNDKTFPLRPAWNAKKDGNWMAALKAAGLGVDDIDFVMCTHLHGDHVGWNTRLENGRWVPTFPKARYLFSKKEYDYWSAIHQKTPLDNITDSVLPVIEAHKPELVMRVDTDRDQGVATRRRFFERYCDTDTLCCTMHFPSPSVGHIKRWDDGFRLEYVRD